MRDQAVGGVEDVAEAAVVLLQLDDALDAVLALEVGHVADARAAEGVDALVVVADREHALRRRAGPGGANIFSHAYCSRLVSWNSSTSTWRKRRW